MPPANNKDTDQLAQSDQQHCYLLATLYNTIDATCISDLQDSI